ncbi:uncharacterized protein MYCFIDRAFT_178223 [Pseudocercospora fijiensis CIRAD86]|uniref:Uncharacterized protein n=1 Tax=Pseudocercospora fijiensis (strain CIRAD86) TaxID=383855 RepID=M2ZKN8_PSEFD|nr:uncharacterized protein MYCFIDRAFT_178223 [Pseudocercospora fijiensis CIRAD86]EME79639.1 hypothetical protein MYCFIDRAFT_178223 [Pseudocercospora fijiensis CIRAD86]
MRVIKNVLLSSVKFGGHRIASSTTTLLGREGGSSREREGGREGRHLEFPRNISFITEVFKQGVF